MNADPDPSADAVERVSLSARLRQTKTIVSILVPLAIIAFFVALNRESLSKVPGLIAGANPVLVLVAFVVFYLGFPLRGLRWAMLLRGTGFRIGVRDSTEILYLSWLVNCLVPAKLGDVYRAYLLRINSDASLSRTFGTVFIERILDIFTIALLGIAAGYWSFRSGLPPSIQLLFGIALVVVARARRGAVHAAQLRPADPRRAAPRRSGSWSSTTASSRASSAPSSAGSSPAWRRSASRSG